MFLCHNNKPALFITFLMGGG